LASLEKSTVYLQTPELIYGSILVAIAAFGFAWWLRSRFSKKRIAALHEQMRLGKQVQEHITNELQSLKQKVSLEETTIQNPPGGASNAIVKQRKCHGRQFACRFRASEYEPRRDLNLDSVAPSTSK